MKKTACHLILLSIIFLVLSIATETKATTYYYTGNLFNQGTGTGDPSLLGDSIHITLETVSPLTDGFYDLDSNVYLSVSMTDGITTFIWTPDAPSPISIANVIMSDGLIAEWAFMGYGQNGTIHLYSDWLQGDRALYFDGTVSYDKFVNLPGTWTISRKPRIFGLFVGVQDGIFRGDLMAMELESTFKATFQHLKIYGGSRTLMGIVTEDGGLTSFDVGVAINEMKLTMVPGDVFWLYITGHGGSTPTGTETTSNPGNEGVLLGYRSSTSGWLLDDDLSSWLKNMDGTGEYGKLVFIDSCHSGGFWGDSNPADLGDLEKLKNIALVAAAYEECIQPSGKECFAIADPQTNLPLFGAALADALKLEVHYMRGDRNNNGMLEAEEILPHYLVYNQMRTGLVYEMEFGDPIEFSPDLLHPQFFKSDDFAGNIEYTVITPGTVGTQITITGTGFGTKKGKVTVGEKSCKVSEWASEWVTCVIKTALTPPGPYDVAVKPKEPKDAPIVPVGIFTMMAPDIVSVDRSSGVSGDERVLSGNYFGSKKGKVYLGTKSCKVLSWGMDATTGESEIRFFVPRKIPSGTYNVTVTNKVGSVTLTDGFIIP